MKKLFVLLIFLICNIAVSQTGWYFQNSGTSRCLNSLYFVNSNTGWAVGDSVVLKTTNGGQNWISQTIPVQAVIRSVHFLNANTGFLAGDKNYLSSYVMGTYVFKTTNGGVNWNTIYSYTPSIIGTAYINDVYAVNENVIFRTYSEYLAYTSGGSVFKSTNGGINYSISLNCGTTKGLSFTDSQTGWTICTEQSSMMPIIFRIYKTTNTGNNWSLMYTSDSMSFILGRGIQFLNTLTGYALGYSGDKTSFLKTTNGGINWTLDTLNNNNNRAMYFANTNTGWIGGYTSSGNSNIARTTNGGLNWSYQNTGGTQIINGLFFTDAMTGWAVGFYGAILKTVTGGVTGLQNISIEIPASYSLYQNYPNPFNSNTIIRFQIPLEVRSQETGVRLKVFDLMGREVRTLVDEELKAGVYEVRFEAGDLPSGVYFYRMETEKYTDTKKLILLK